MSVKELGSSILLCILSSTDNFSVGVSYSISKKKIPLLSNGVIAMMNGVTTLCTMLAGEKVTSVLDPDIATCLGAGKFSFLYPCISFLLICSKKINRDISFSWFE